jgi:hypothetical protein
MRNILPPPPKLGVEKLVVVVEPNVEGLPNGAGGGLLALKLPNVLVVEGVPNVEPNVVLLVLVFPKFPKVEFVDGVLGRPNENVDPPPPPVVLDPNVAKSKSQIKKLQSSHT